MLSLTETHLQFAGYPHIHSADFLQNKMYEWNLIFLQGSKLRTLKNQLQGCNKFFCKTRARQKESARTYCSQDLKQVSPFQTTSVEWNWQSEKNMELLGCFVLFFNLFLTQLAPTWQRNAVSKSHTQMTLTWVRVVNIHVHKDRRTSSLLKNDHCSLQLGGEGGKLSSTRGLSAQVCQERDGRH